MVGMEATAGLGRMHSYVSLCCCVWLCVCGRVAVCPCVDQFSWLSRGCGVSGHQWLQARARHRPVTTREPAPRPRVPVLRAVPHRGRPVLRPRAWYHRVRDRPQPWSRAGRHLRRPLHARPPERVRAHLSVRTAPGRRRRLLHVPGCAGGGADDAAPPTQGVSPLREQQRRHTPVRSDDDGLPPRAAGAGRP